MKFKKILVKAPWEIELTEDSFTEKITDPQDFIVENHYSHLSAGTELACVSGIEDWFPLPNTPGYTTIGKIIEKGDEVKHVNVGDMIYTMGPHASHFKVNMKDRFHGLCVKLPDGIQPDLASFTHIGGIAMSSIRASNIELGDVVAVSGMGAIGNLAAQFAQLQGGRVIAIDINNSRLEMARNCGISVTINPDNQDLYSEIAKFTNGEKVSTWIDATGLSGVINNAVNHIAMRGELILLGSPRAAHNADLTPLLRKIHLIEAIQIKGALEFLWPTFENDFNKHSIERNSKIVMDLIRSNKVNIQPFYSHKLSPEKAAEAYFGLRDKPDEYVGVVFDWTVI